MTYSWHDLAGNIGVVYILATYLLLQLERLSATSPSYSIANGLGAFLTIISIESSGTVTRSFSDVFDHTDCRPILLRHFRA